MSVLEYASSTAEAESHVIVDAVEVETPEALHERNMAAFAKYQPEAHAVIARYKTQSKLVYTEDGEPDVEFQGENLYEGRGADAYTKDQLEKYWKKPMRVMMPMGLAGDNHAALFSKPFLDRLKEAEIGIDPVPTSRSAYFLVIFGIGLAPHIEMLVADTGCRELILIEPNPEFIYHSTYVYDWESLFERFSGDRGLAIVVSSRSEGVQNSIQSVIRSRNPSGFDGTLFYPHYKNSAFKKAYDDFSSGGMSTAMMGLGFFEDEINMIAQSYENLRHGKRRIFKTSPDRMKLPVFIVANGPSLDNLMPVIKENKDKAVIVACGSALDPLMYAGIVPDFVALLERNPQLFPELRISAEEFDLSEVCFVGASNVYPGICDLFGDSILFFRPGISPNPLFSRHADQRPPRPDPLVANAGLVFSAIAGFREVYFFGVDVGAKDPNYHHSKKSWYTTRGHSYDHFTFDVTTPGNFGGTVVSTSVLMWSKSALEGSIQHFPGGIRYYNCSEGALIEGAVPKHFSTVSLPDIDDKNKLVRELIESFPFYTQDDFDNSWKSADIFSRLREVRDTLIEILEDEDDFSDMNYMRRMMKVLLPGAVSDPVAMVYRGSIYFMLMVLHSTLLRLKSDDDREALQKIAREEFTKAMDCLKDQATQKFKDCEAGAIDWSQLPTEEGASEETSKESA